jgi:glycosyltransferase involved in cell wall biosynthesis
VDAVEVGRERRPRRWQPPDAPTRGRWSAAEEPLRIAMLAPPWLSVPPSGYGGVESVVSSLTEALVHRGHAVTLFCAPGSVSDATVATVLDSQHPDEIERSLYEVDHVARALEAIDEAAEHSPFDVLHDHCGFTALAMADRIATPIVHTLHGQFTAATAAFYVRHAHKAVLVGVSQAQLASAPPELAAFDVIPNPIDLSAWPLVERKDDYVLWIGRVTPEKGPQRAIAAANAAGVPLILAGVVQPGQQGFFDHEVAPHLDGDRVRFVGEVGGTQRQSLFSRARGLLMPIRWEEPFGMVMVEAMACGTPVIAFPEGAARELVAEGRTGFLVDDEREMAAAIARLPEIVARDCRSWVSDRCDVEVVSAAYEQVYRSVAARRFRTTLAYA